MLRASLLALVGSEACCCRCSSCYGNEGFVMLHFVQHPVREEFRICLAWFHLGHCSICISQRSTTIIKIERHSPMPSFLVVYGRSIAMTFLCVDMYYCWLVGILDTTEHLNKTLYIVAFLQILILKSPSLEPVVLALATALAKRTQILIYTAMVLGDRHLVVVYNDDDARAKLRSLIKSFESLTARQRTVAYYGYDILLGSLHVARLLQSSCKTDGCGSVAHLKVIVLRTLCRRRITRYGIHIVYVAKKSGCTTGQYLMRIALVANVEHKLILWSVEHIVQSYRCFYKSKIRTYVSAMLAHTVEHSLAHFVGYNIKCRDVHAFQVGRTLYLLYIHRLLIDLFVRYCLTLQRY